MATVLAPTYPVNPRLQRRAVPAKKPHAKFPAAMLIVAIFLDGVQLLAAAILFAMIAIPGVGLIFWVLGFLANILITVVAFMLFTYWLHSIGLGKSVIVGLFLAVITEIFTSGGAPSWTLFVLRARHLAKKHHESAVLTA